MIVEIDGWITWHQSGKLENKCICKKLEIAPISNRMGKGAARPNPQKRAWIDL